MPTPLPPSFIRKKNKILAQLSVPETEYDDLSPKGCIDAGIRDLIDEMNGREGLVTTSSCGGRVSVFLEGVKSNSSGSIVEDLSGRSQEEGSSIGDRDGAVVGKLAGVGGKGGGGRWLFVSHERIDVDLVGESFAKFLGMGRDGMLEGEVDKSGVSPRLIHFKFEPMVCTIDVFLIIQLFYLGLLIFASWLA